MKRFAKLICMALLAGASWWTSTPSMAQQKINNGFKLKSVYGSEVMTDLSPGKGYRIVDFWASWCESCKTNLEKLEPLQRKLSQKKVSSQVVAVSVDESKKDARSFFEVNGPGSSLKMIRQHAWFDENQSLSQRVQFEGLPYLVVLDAKGTIVMRHSGALSLNDIKKLEALVNHP